MKKQNKKNRHAETVEVFLPRNAIQSIGLTAVEMLRRAQHDVPFGVGLAYQIFERSAAARIILLPSWQPKAW